MAIEQIAVDTGILQNDIETIEEALNEIKERTESMFTNMQELDTMWDGVANKVFIAQFQKDYTTMQELNNAITSILKNLKTAKKEYEICESSVGTLISEIKIESV